MKRGPVYRGVQRLHRPLVQVQELAVSFILRPQSAKSFHWKQNDDVIKKQETAGSKGM